MSLIIGSLFVNLKISFRGFSIFLLVSLISATDNFLVEGFVREIIRTCESIVFFLQFSRGGKSFGRFLRKFFYMSKGFLVVFVRELFTDQF